MERGLLAPLSPNEESALRRVAHRISKPKHLRGASVERLKLLAQRFAGKRNPDAAG
jgi:fructose 1,6-bisphosphatase